MSLAYDPLTDGWVFDTASGPRALVDPDGPPSARQLLLLNHRGLLQIRDEPGPCISKLDAALAIERAGGGRPRRTNDQLAVDMLDAVALHPGSTWGEITALVHGANVRLAWIRKQLVLDGRLVIVREGQRMRLYVPGDAPW